MPVQVKICGVSTHDALGAAVKSGASHIGFVFFEKSPRNVSLDQAAALSETLPDHVKTVALVVDPEAIFVEKIISALPRLGALQFTGKKLQTKSPCGAAKGLNSGRQFLFERAPTLSKLPNMPAARTGSFMMPSLRKEQICLVAPANALTGHCFRDIALPCPGS